MKVVIIGSGNVATVLGKKMHQGGIEILQVIGRNKDEGSQLAKILNASYTSEFTEINKNADVYMIAVSDTYISSVACKLNLKNKIIFHTAGSVSKDVLRHSNNYSCTYGVIYPLQSLKRENQSLPPVPVLVDGSDDRTLLCLKEFAGRWAENVAQANDEQRLKMHIAAVFASNFTTFMYVMANEFCNAEQLDFKMLLPLINETCDRLRLHSPAEMQTGPAVRKDISTIHRHLDILSKYPRLQGMYKMISAEILDQSFPH